MTKVRLCLLSLVLLPACAGRAIDPQANEGRYTPASAYTDSRATAAERAQAGASCTTDADCCAENFCQTFSVYTNDWRTCVPKRADGAFCYSAHECACGSCVSSTCGTGCAPANAECAADSDCCHGMYCNARSYAASFTCVAVKADGARCYGDTECASGHCGADLKCFTPAPACGAAGSACSAPSDCCAGTFCNANSYVASLTCVATKPDGGRCYDDTECTSTHCDLNTLKCVTPAPACGSVGAACQTQSNCCSGSYCDVFTYLGRKCRAAGAPGVECYTNEMCASHDCDVQTLVCR